MAGVLLAAGSGRRFGKPKALVDNGSGPWVLTTLAVMSACDHIVVVLGAQADLVESVLGPRRPGLTVCRNDDHLTGMGSSLAMGLSALAAPASDPASEYDAALVMLVDLPDVTPAVLDRLVAVAGRTGSPAGVLARAAYDGRAGHPVLIGREHFVGVIAGAVGDAGARDYLRDHQVLLVECADVGGGRDVDTPDQV